MANDFAFEMAASAVRFGAGVTREVGADLAEMGLTNVLVITDPILRGWRRCRPSWSRSRRAAFRL